jgi:hypothetical protein
MIAGYVERYGGSEREQLPHCAILRVQRESRNVNHP